jgi:nitroimidazol reductase NimA-like FMN-containing flavoprotein (pyridoxamine 5'-phosphate oxidase superfamily)
MSTAIAEFRKLENSEAHEFLSLQRVGRIAYAFHDHVDIEPVHYAFDGAWIFGRTSIGAKLSSLAHNPWCAFEVDEVHDVFDWTSVVVKGSLHLLDPETGADTYLRALSMLRTIVPETFLAGDPVPNRTILFGIYANEVTGRTAAAKHA